MPKQRSAKHTAGIDPVSMLRAKREAQQHHVGEIRHWIESYMRDEVTDYQMSAWLMAVVLNGLDTREMLELTDAMLASGRRLKLERVAQPKVDKHSTGGVGDKVSICLAPLVAATGVCVPMISGRGLGHTGGTLDKLEAIPGFKVQLDIKRFERQLSRIGVAMIGQTPDLAPADRRLYALRDVTATVESIPLIVASILSKKLAEGIDSLVLDVKVGRGAFMRDMNSARALARALLAVSKRANKRASALLTNMDRPLGLTIGNALETREALEVLHGRGPSDTRELTLALGSEMLVICGHAPSRTRARAELERAIANGNALERMAQMVTAQGGDARCVEHPERLPRARHTLLITATRRGTLADVDPLELGRVAVALGAGRTRADQAVDPKAGIELLATQGDRVRPGTPLCRLHASRRGLLDQVRAQARQCFRIGRAPATAPLIHARLR